jgi:hypothetical protein
MEVSIKNKKDFTAGIVLCGIGIYGIIASLGMPIPSKWVDSPGILPLLICCLLLALSIGLVITSCSSERNQTTEPFSISEWIRGPDQKRLFLGLVLIFAYLFFAIPFLGYYLATPAFLFVFMLFFAGGTTMFKKVLYATVTTLLIYLIFSKLFVIPL